MEEDSKLRLADRILEFLSKVGKSYKKEKTQKQRAKLVDRTLSEEPRQELLAFQHFRDDPNVDKVFWETSNVLLQTRENWKRYNTCAGLLSAILCYS